MKLLFIGIIVMILSFKVCEAWAKDNPIKHYDGNYPKWVYCLMVIFLLSIIVNVGLMIAIIVKW